MFYELASAFAGLVLMQVTIFIVGDALGLLGERFEKTKLMANWMADMPDTLVGYFFSHTTETSLQIASDFQTLKRLDISRSVST